MSTQMYTQEQLNIALLEQKNDGFNQSLNRIERRLDSMDSKIDSTQKLTLRLMGTGFIGVFTIMAAMFGVMAHGFHWSGF